MNADDQSAAGALNEMRGALDALEPAAARAFESMRRGAERSSREMGALGREIRNAAGDFRQGFRAAFSSAFDELFRKGAKASDVLRGLALDVARVVARGALERVGDAAGDALGGAVGRLLPFAKGGVVDAGRVRAFARGGVVEGPTAFPMARGVGLMGEAGPEAILPLRRGPDGGLGVAAPGGGAPTVIVNIATPDVEGFQRSRGQIAAQLARAVDRGRRNL